MEKEPLFEEFCRALEGQEVDIMIHTRFEGDSKIKMKGPLPLLFHAACEIVKQLALKEADGQPGLGKRYVAVLCQEVSDELDEMEGLQAEGGEYR